MWLLYPIMIVILMVSGGVSDNTTGCDIGYWRNSSSRHHSSFSSSLLIPCIPVGKGYYSPNNATPHRYPCSPGTYSNLLVAQACQPCFPGTYNSDMAQDKCQPCPTGTIQPHWSQIKCIRMSLVEPPKTSTLLRILQEQQEDDDDNNDKGIKLFLLAGIIVGIILFGILTTTVYKMVTTWSRYRQCSRFRQYSKDKVVPSSASCKKVLAVEDKIHAARDDDDNKSLMKEEDPPTLLIRIEHCFKVMTPRDPREQDDIARTTTSHRHRSPVARVTVVMDSPDPISVVMDDSQHPVEVAQ